MNRIRRIKKSKSTILSKNLLCASAPQREKCSSVYSSPAGGGLASFSVFFVGSVVA
jgi:hypothetical protein